MVSNLETHRSSSVVRTPIVDIENPRTTKFKNVLVSQFSVPTAFSFGIKKGEYRNIKEIPVIPSFADMDHQTRTIVVDNIFRYGNAPSCVFLKLLGLTARQVGAIRRWHIPKWRMLNNQKVRNADNLNRLFIRGK